MNAPKESLYERVRAALDLAALYKLELELFSKIVGREPDCDVSDRDTVRRLFDEATETVLQLVTCVMVKERQHVEVRCANEETQP